MSVLFPLLIFFINTWLCRYSHATDSKSQLRFLSAMCQSRCLLEVEHGEIPNCIKPCLQLKLHTVKNIKKCKTFCEENASGSGTATCAESCSFLQQRLLNGKTSSCPKGKVCSSPATAGSVNVTDVNTTLSVLSWSSPGQGTWAAGTIFVITARSRSAPEESFGPWFPLDQTTQTSLVLTLKERTLWYQFQVVAVNDVGASEPRQSAVVQLAVNRPNPPRDLRVTAMEVNSKGLVNLVLRWRKPADLDIPVHRYRVYWSERLARSEWSDTLVDLRLHQARVSGKVHVFQKNDLKQNQTYVFELQAISRWKSKRLRSKLTYITISTPSKSERSNKNTKQGDSLSDSNAETIIEVSRIPTARSVTSGTSTDASSQPSSTYRPSSQPLGVVLIALLLLYIT